MPTPRTVRWLAAALALSGCGLGTGTSDSAPSVTILAPLAGSTVSGTVSIDASAVDDGGVLKVRVLIDGVLLPPEIFTAPYHALWNTTAIPNGTSHVIRVEAIDGSNHSGFSQITVGVQNGHQ